MIKGDVLDYFNVRNRDDIINTNQYIATVFLLKKCPETIELINEWLRICCQYDYKFIDDSISSSPNHNKFREHRHDQSIFSILRKIKKIGTVLPDETWPINIQKWPIWATRKKY